MTDQLAFSQLLAEADERANAIRDLHRGRVQQWFDDLPEDKKLLLSTFMTEHEWDTCSALSVAACDHHRGHSNGVRQ